VNESQARDAVNGAALVVTGIYFYRKLIEPAQSAPASAIPGAARAGEPLGLSQNAALQIPIHAPGEPTTIGGAAAQLVGVGPLASPERFIVGFGFAFLVLALAESASPELAGGFALLIGLGSILGNGQQVAADLRTQLSEKAAPAGGQAATEPNTPTVQLASFENRGSKTVGIPTPAPRQQRRSRRQRSTGRNPRTTIA
jgi:hypothetical protein